MPLLSPPCSRKERAATERMFSWFCALCSGEYRILKEYARTLMPVKARRDPARVGCDGSKYVEEREAQTAELGTGMSNRFSTLDAVFSTVSNSTELIPKRAAASTFSARSSRYKMSRGSALTRSRQCR